MFFAFQPSYSIKTGTNATLATFQGNPRRFNGLRNPETTDEPMTCDRQFMNTRRLFFDVFPLDIFSWMAKIGAPTLQCFNVGAPIF
jgi:hypothetical protein